MAIVAGKGFSTEHGLVETEAFGQALVASGIPVGQRAVVPSGDTPHSGHKAAGGSHAVPGVHAPRGRPGRDVGDQAVEEIGLDLKHQKLPQPPRPGRACRKRGLAVPDLFVFHGALTVEPVKRGAYLGQVGPAQAA